MCFFSLFGIFKFARLRYPSYSPPKKNRGITNSRNSGGNILIDGHYLIKRSAIEKVKGDFPYNDPRRLLLFDGYLFRIEIADKLIRLTVNNGVYESEIKYFKTIIRNYYFSCFERLDIIILKCCKGGPNKKINDDRLDVIANCFRDVNELGASVFNKILSSDKEKSTNGLVVVYFDIWVNTYKGLYSKVSKL